MQLATYSLLLQFLVHIKYSLHKNIDDIRQYLLHVWMAYTTRASLTLQLMRGMGISKHVFRQMVDTLSNQCDNVRSHSAIWQESIIFVRYENEVYLL